MKKILLKISKIIYKCAVRKIFFLHDSETIHEIVVGFGETLGTSKIITNALKFFMKIDDPILKQTVSNIKFQNPIGLAAGFDYNAQLTQLLPSLGFGFGTIGTITNSPYKGNPKPRLGRLVKSKSLMVNKGLKNKGIKYVAEKLKNSSFDIPIGLSIGQTNSKKLTTQKQAVGDIVDTFKIAEMSKISFAYYELNISCPNLAGNISFYKPDNLGELLDEIKKFTFKIPLFIKMPIDKNNRQILEMLEIIVKYPVAGVIFGNLQKKRTDPVLDPEEVKKYNAGYFSGKPTEKRSNELIKLAYRNYKNKLVIIGCGGVFSTQDAYRKIKLGASLIQLITGLIYEGPQLASEINLELKDLLRKDGLNNVSEAIGMDVDPRGIKPHINLSVPKVYSFASR